jgi:hypothetical protein
MTMYQVGELVVSGLIMLSAYGLIYAAGFNENVLNKKAKRRVMETKMELKKGWQKLTTARDIRDRLPMLNGTQLSSTEFAVLCLVSHQEGNATITTVVNHPYFTDVSLSTIKRAVTGLITEKLVTASEGAFDRRERLLAVCDENDG